MRIVIPALEEDCPAALALGKEGLLFEVRIMEDNYDYGRLWTELWNDGESFIIIEHDVAPWPGAIYEIMECPKWWCSFMYPNAPHHLVDSLGCIKIDENLIREAPNAPSENEWRMRTWNILDGYIVPALIKTGEKSHIHEPPLAHVKK